MNRRYFLSLVILIFLAFSGCSMLPTQKTQVGNASFTLSPVLWKSTDGGTAWEAKIKGEGKAAITNPDVLSIAINPNDNDNIYAGLRKGGILESTDGGEVWKFMNFQSEKVYGLAFDPSSGKTLLASGVWQGRGKIFKTEDGGANWKEIYTSPSNGPLVISLTIDKKNPRVIYATTSDKEALKSADGGETWKNINIANSPIMRIAIDADNSDLIYFITQSGGIFRSRDGGENIEGLSDKISKNFKGLGGNQFTVVEADPSISMRVLVAGSGGIAESTDGGENWTKINSLNNPKNFPIKVLAVSPNNSQDMVYGAAKTIYKSEDGGSSWSTFQFDNKTTVNALEYDPSGSGNLYLGFSK